MSRVALQTGARAGAVTLLSGYAASVGIKLQIYRARVGQFSPPTAYVESLTEGTDDFSKDESQRSVSVLIRVVWGVFDSGDAVDQRDRFVDGFYAYVADNGAHAFGPNTTCSWRSVSDDPDFTADWIEGDTRPKFATAITLEGFAST